MEDTALRLKRALLLGALVFVSTALTLEVCADFVHATLWGIRSGELRTPPFLDYWAWMDRALFFVAVAFVFAVATGIARWVEGSRVPFALVGLLSTAFALVASIQVLYTTF